ncbi:MAG: InlB B-repeat-containing protein, partial [Clostridia bacterium]|nr:InlB B-repeat-containing protein [Clostridia bacterium]
YDVINYFFNAVTEVPTFFTVTFDANGGQCDTTSLEIINGETVSALPTPVREGFDFLGWFDENGGEFTAETAVTADITVTAKWEVAQPPLDDLSWEIESYLYARYRGRRVSLHNVPYTLYHDYETEVALLNGEVVVIGRTTNYYGEKWLLTEEGDWVKESDVTKIEDLMPFILSDDVNYPEKLHLSYTSCKLYGTVTSLSGDIKTVNGGILTPTETAFTEQPLRLTRRPLISQKSTIILPSEALAPANIITALLPKTTAALITL